MLKTLALYAVQGSKFNPKKKGGGGDEGGMRGRGKGRGGGEEEENSNNNNDAWTRIPWNIHTTHL